MPLGELAKAPGLRSREKEVEPQSGSRRQVTPRLSPRTELVGVEHGCWPSCVDGAPLPAPSTTCRAVGSII